ncbi:MAG: nucleotidyltransferase family protein [Pseudomonadota bacterium]
MVGHVFARHAELSGAVPRDLKVFFLAMYTANQKRLSEGLSQLRSIGSIFSAANIPAVALKGGGDMLEPLHPDPAMRFVADLDILVPSGYVSRAERLLFDELDAMQPYEKLSEDSDLNWRGERVPEHHLPKLTAENWQFPVELHRLVGSGKMADLLPAEIVIGRSTPTSIPGVSIMNPDDRACHLIAHAARHGDAVTLRAWIDWVRLAPMCAGEDVRARLAQSGFERKLDEFNHVGAYLEKEYVGERPKNEVVRSALSAFGDAPIKRRRGALELVASRLRTIFVSAKYRQHIALEMTSWRWWERVWSTLRRDD